MRQDRSFLHDLLQSFDRNVSDMEALRIQTFSYRCDVVSAVACHHQCLVVQVKLLIWGLSSCYPRQQPFSSVVLHSSGSEKLDEVIHSGEFWINFFLENCWVVCL